MFAKGHAPKRHFSAAAMAKALEALRLGHLQSPRARPLLNGKNRPYLPIDTGIPCPGSRTARAARPWQLLEIGDSFFEPLDGLTVAGRTDRMVWDAKAYKPRRFFLSEATENGVAGVRAWRVE
jgi:hypothetical protein